MTDSEMEKQIRRPMVRSTWCSSVKEKTPGSVKEKTAALLHRAVRHKCTPMAQSRMALLAAALLLLPANVAADMYDVVMPAYLPPAGCAACRAWDATVDAALWADPLKALAGAKSHCAMPAANLTGHDKATPEGSYGGPWCYCKATGAAVSCVAPKATPEQINLQLAAPSVVVVSFVTYDVVAPTSPPVATLAGGDLDAPKQIEGVSHMYYDPPNKRNYTMSFVRFSGLASRATYTYKVKSAGAWSASFTFRAPYAAGATKVAIYGDMGNSVHNNMENLKSDCVSGKIDAIVHMGDHCCASLLPRAHSSSLSAFCLLSARFALLLFAEIS